MSLDRFAAQTATLAASLGILSDDPIPRVYRTRLNLSGNGPVVEWAGLGVVVGGKRVPYYGPALPTELQALEAEMVRYRDSFC